MKKQRQLSLFAEINDDVESSGHRPSVPQLLALAMALGAKDVCGWSPEEENLIRNLPPVSRPRVESLRDQILAGSDPLGDLFCTLRSPTERRERGATFTPPPIVSAMIDWAEQFALPDRIVDPGIGSGRFAVAAGHRFRRATLLGIESDPLPAILARANLSASGFADRSQVILSDYRNAPLPAIDGKTLFMGNPPYVRHHLIEPRWKQWLVEESSRHGFAASQLAGLHVHFFLATVAKAASRDFGIFITAAEWMDVNYGSLVRELFLGPLGGRRIVVIEPTAMPFPDAAATAAITAFQFGSRPKSIRFKRVESIDGLRIRGKVRCVRRDRLETERRWSHLTRPVRKGPAGYVELGELCRVHRGQVTGANKVWIAGEHSIGLPESVLYPTVTRAKELFNAGKWLIDTSRLRRVIDLPIDLDVFDPLDRKAVDKFLSRAKTHGADKSYVASNRRAWWSVGLRQPAPILATYMARRPPAFVHNRAEARHINIAHGLYPREPLTEIILRNLVEYLSGGVNLEQGRTYAGGLTKFEPREMERLLIPGLEILRQGES